MRCICCNEPMGTPIKRKPITTHSGGMKDKFHDHIEQFPWNEEEDLCHNCREPIKNSNKDTNPNSVEYGVKVHFYDLAEQDKDAVDEGFRKADQDYQGWGQLIKLYD